MNCHLLMICVRNKLNKMVLTRSQTKFIEAQQVEEQRFRGELTTQRAKFLDDYIGMSIWFRQDMTNDMNEFEKVNGMYMQISLMADIFMKITEYLPVIISNMTVVEEKNSWIRIATIAYEKQYEFYEDVYIKRKPKTIEELCVMNKFIRTLQIAQPILRSLVSKDVVLKDEIEFKLYDTVPN